MAIYDKNLGTKQKALLINLDRRIYGSFAEYIYRGIGVSREEEQRLRELYLV